MEIIGMGSEIIECLRIRRMIERHGEFFLLRVYTMDEIEDCQQRRQSTELFAARWAAKEAVYRSIGTPWRRGLAWTDVEIRYSSEGEPHVQLRGMAKELSERRGVQTIRLTTAFCRAYATATSLALGGGAKPSIPPSETD
ncbi:holo-ACP synthase [Tuwongella immobilis]|uniref:Holo-[acyl-carrier-protein] synthase n=1 Tax=Tuwongella immobilis TaxID=692036 RepID=A0A6C2YMN8_9BACT|nr:holo-ACP synthase [Tuwongella immobilis]VIP02383.1 holo- : Holo-[acyl-carrier-protein] synthase OS=Singulisphaera acidiphila (strain ATCC BAA-1392 / DSM 18658 / VKM B-2454 / MOB10) GN=acpS PE=3 SV=1: ACPS [Tuwongella immobilis]VTS01235.1 holo- : Holo-[acyl-carrier-protein] synthase OS=Singulisphaera acidiphila (strain ATCC BAA-1392 / DSM 18658 / VKM B-2454 / MOB10) GN=acpS PE=3 SV=1: ACPS [Tuwongella immobilis]